MPVAVTRASGRGVPEKAAGGETSRRKDDPSTGAFSIATPVLPREFFERDPIEVAPDLIGKLVVRGNRIGRIVEVEAYRGEDDPASHAYNGETPRNSTMFGPPGHLYVYFTYGMHYCANVVCRPAGVPGAVLVRALAPLGGIEEMRKVRPAALRDADLCSGPGKLCQALSIDRRLDGLDIVGTDSPLIVVDQPSPVRGSVGTSPRIGLGAGRAARHRSGGRSGWALTQEQALTVPWRFFLVGDRNLSRRAPRAARMLEGAENRVFVGAEDAARKPRSGHPRIPPE